MIDYLFIKNIEEIDIQKWNRFLKNHSGSNIFQSLELYSFWNSQSNHEPFYFLVTSINGDCLGFCAGVIISNGKGIKKIISKRAIIYGEPLVSSDADKICDLYEFIIGKIEIELSKRANYTEIRCLSVNESFKKIFYKRTWQYTPYQNYIINLSNEEELMQKITPEKRRQIRKSLKDGASFSYLKSEKNILGVYQILQEIYRNKVKKPLPKFNFFLDLMKLEDAGVVAVIADDIVIGGGFFLKDKQTIYDWYRGGLDFEYKKLFPSTLAAWGVMNYGLSNKIQNFDFMGAGIKGQEYGVRKFKSQFGGILIENGRFMKINNSLFYNIGKMALTLKKKIH